MRWIFLLSLSASVSAFAQVDDCTALKRALAIAEQAGVNSGELWRLERQRCQPAAPANGGLTCTHLDAFSMLAVASGAAAEVTGSLEAQRSEWCGRGDEPTRQLQWSTGAVLRNTSGTLFWPDGTMARSSSGTWYSDSGTMLRSTSGTLYYPSGSMLRSSSGRVTLPTGEQADEGRLAALACRGDVGWCRWFLAERRASTGPKQDFALLGLALLAGRE